MGTSNNNKKNVRKKSNNTPNNSTKKNINKPNTNIKKEIEKIDKEIENNIIKNSFKPNTINKYQKKLTTNIDFRRLIILIIFIIIFVILNVVIFSKFGDNLKKIDEKIIETKKENNVNYPYFKQNKLDDKIKEIKNNVLNQNAKVNHETYVIEDKYANVFFEIENETIKEHQSYLLNAKGEEINIDNILITDKNEIFRTKVLEQLSVKYPKFIVDAIANGQGRISYNIKENKMIIYFENFEINPNPNKDIFIVLNYHEIKDLLNFTFVLDKEYINENIVPLDPAKPTIAFTFDDGPAIGKTDVILDLLKENHASASFFMLGTRMKSSPEIINRMLKEGNDGASHTWSHKSLTNIQDPTINEEVGWANDTFKNVSGYDFTMLRPPYGNINEHVKNYIQGNSFILWSIDTRDWADKNTERIKNDILNTIKDGDIVLMHDLYLTTVEAVRVVLPELYAKGYQVVSVSKLASLKGINLAPNTTYRYIR